MHGSEISFRRTWYSLKIVTIQINIKYRRDDHWPSFFYKKFKIKYPPINEGY